MGVAGSFAGYGVFVVAKRLGAPWIVAAFLAGLLSDWVTYAATSLILALGLHGDAALGTMFAEHSSRIHSDPSSSGHPGGIHGCRRVSLRPEPTA